MLILTPSSFTITTTTTTTTTVAFISKKRSVQTPIWNVNLLTCSLKHKNLKRKLCLSSSQSSVSFSSISSSTAIQSAPTARPFSYASSLSSTKNNNRHWIVLMETPQQVVNSKHEIVDYYVRTLERVLGSKKYAQMCIYHASCDTHFGFCCDIDEQATIQLAGLDGVLSVRPDPDYNSEEKDYSSSVKSSHLSNQQFACNLLFPAGNTKYWLVKLDKPGFGVVTKAQMVDYYVEILTKVMGNEKDAQMCIYHVSWQSNFGFYCELDEECAQELAGVPGVLAVQPDKNFESENKNYRGVNIENPENVLDSSQITPVRTKKLFVTGLSFYTSEKTLRAAFDGFGELVEVKIIMDKISKRSKGYAFIEYTTEEAATAALKEMNGKIINGWMIVVDVAKPSPPKRGQGRRRTAA